MSNDQIKFKAGDLVSLKSGGPTMTVSSVNKHEFVEDSVTCYYWSLYQPGCPKELSKVEVPPEVLTKVTDTNRNGY